MKIPNFNEAVVEIKKLQDYCLNESHPAGKHKARVFNSELGLVSDDAEELREALLKAAKECDAILGEEDQFGRRYKIDFKFSKLDKEAIIRSCWIILNKEKFPRLTTCYVNIKPGAKKYEL